MKCLVLKVLISDNSHDISVIIIKSFMANSTVKDSKRFFEHHELLIKTISDYRYKKIITFGIHSTNKLFMRMILYDNKINNIYNSKQKI